MRAALKKKFDLVLVSSLCALLGLNRFEGVSENKYKWIVN